MGTENRLVVAKGDGVGGVVEWKVRASRCKLSYVEETTRSYCVAQGTIANNMS